MNPEATTTADSRPRDPAALWSWQAAEIRRLWRAGAKTTDIAAAVGLNKNQVIGRAHRMGLPPRESPIARSGPRPVQPAAAAVAAASNGRVAVLPGALRAHLDSAVPAVPFDRPPPAQHLPKAPVADRYPSTLRCQAPLWAHGVGRGGPGYGLFCEAPRAFGSAYCDDHRALFVTRVVPGRL